MTNWRELIEDEMRGHGEEWTDVVSSTLSDEEARRDFDCGYGGTEGVAFTVWTENTVYFPITYDGAEWAGSASRHPDGAPTKHQGGG